ncbi:HAD family hydrolase [Desulfopila sp. IMCC35008]|uniref:HAD family hydrolase n=1 Tax=Desulfopila sp. IMCC35008 TaxID=2653858 RepID=UPI0013CF941A|nr:HAD family hydrolase [Desulfopila sp. IMCC35008]
MRKYDSIIFDLDGTLWDATEATAEGWNAALSLTDLANFRVTADDIRGVCGLPFSDCITSLFGHLDDVDCHALEPLLDEKEKFSIEVSGGVVFPDVVEGLQQLSGSYGLYLVSNCQSWYLQSFWQQYAVEHLFKGQDCYGDSGVGKSEMIRLLVQQHNLQNPIYIGDTQGDQEATESAGAQFGYAAYGFGDVKEARIAFNTFRQLIDYFMK